MKNKTAVAIAVFCLATAVITFAQDPSKTSRSTAQKGGMPGMSMSSDAFMGTWKLNEGKSHLASGAAKNSTVAYEAAGDQIKVTIDGTDPSGNPTHSEWTGKMDGKDYPVTGDSASDARSMKQVNAHTASFAAKKAGKTTVSGTIVVAADGKTRTVNSTQTDPSGMKISSTTVYDKQ